MGIEYKGVYTYISINLYKVKGVKNADFAPPLKINLNL